MSDELELNKPRLKFTIDDFKTKDAIDGLKAKWESLDGHAQWEGYSITNDSEGYTSICFAAMNGIKPDKIVYLANNKKCDPDHKCGKGKIPLQCAILSGCKESVDALIGNDVYVYDDTTEEIVDSTTEAPEFDQPKKDAAGNPVPKRDSDDNIIYKEDSSSGVVYPLNPSNLKDPLSVNAEPVTHQLGKTMSGDIVQIPPASVEYSIIYKYEDDGTHSPMRDNEGNPIKQCRSDGSEIHKKDKDGKDIRNKFEYVWDYEYQPEYAIAYEKETTRINESAKVIEDNLSEAAKLPKADILEALGNKHRALQSPSYNYASITDKFDHTLLYSACMMSCYASVDYILNTLVTDNSLRAQYIIKECGTDDDSKKSALDVAVENEDEMLVRKLCSYLDDKVLDEVFEAAFAHKWHSVVNTVLLYVIDPHYNIYDYLENKYKWGSPGEDRTIAQYIEYEQNDFLYDILLKNYSIHKIQQFISGKYYHIIAHLYKNNKNPFTGVADYKFNQVLLGQDRFDSVYSDVVAVLYKDKEVNMKNICDISDKTKRNACVDKIFTSSYNSTLLKELIETDSENMNLVLKYLYDRSYFKLQQLVELCDNENQYDKFFGFIDSLEVDLSTIVSDITNGDFEKRYIIYLFNNYKITLTDIERDITDDKELKKSVVIETYNDSVVTITAEDIINYTPSVAVAVINDLYDNGSLRDSDIYKVYDNYNDTLSNLRDDLRPIVGYMKYSHKAISTDYYWMYQFDNYEGNNWYNPQYWPSLPTESMKNIDEQQVSSSGQYTDVKIISEASLPFTPESFRLDTYNDRPEFYMGQEDYYSVESNENAVIVSFNESVGAGTFIVPEGMVYTVNEDREITWNEDHLLYKLLKIVSARCYLTVEESINHVPTLSPEASTNTCYPGETITLYANALDPDGDTLMYEWSCDQDSDFSSTSSDPTFTIPDNLTGATTYTFRVKVTDNLGASNTETVSVKVLHTNNSAPDISISTPIVEGNPGDTVTLSIDVVDVDDDNYTVVWSGSEASHLISVNDRVKKFKIPENATPETSYVFNIIVTDDHSNVSTKSITVKVATPSSIGTFAFTSGTFAVDLDPGTLVYTTKSNGVITQHTEIVKDAWGSVYEEGYGVPQVPKSPNYTDNNKVFTYNLLYSEDSDN